MSEQRGAQSPEGKWSWAVDAAAVEARRRHAQGLVGQRLVGVRYWTLDYDRWELCPDVSGPRVIEASSEWVDPCWRSDGFDASDYGVELETSAGLVYSVTWDPPGDIEGIGLRDVPMRGHGVAMDADVAVWDVSDRSGWTRFVGNRVTGVDLHYVPWFEDDGSWWCPHITLHFEAGDVELILGDEENDELTPSSDNVAIIFDGRPVREWATG